MPSRSASFTVLWSSQALSALGTSVSSLAYPLLVLDISGSALSAGLVGAVMAAVGLAARVPGGVLADRFRYRSIMLAADVARGTTVGGLALAVAAGAVTLPLVLVAVAVEVALGSLFGPAEFALLRGIVEPASRSIAVGRMQSRSALAGLVGPAIGGGLYGVAPALPFLLDACSYAASAVLVASLRGARHLRAPAGERPSSLAPAASAGWRWLRGQTFLLSAALWVSALHAVFGAVGLALLVLARDRGALPVEIGAMFAIGAAGALVGAVLTPALQRRVPPARLLQLAAIVDTLVTLAILPLSSPYLIGVLGALAFLLAPAVTATVMGEVSRTCPDELVGRAQATVTLLTGVCAPLAPVAIGAILDLAGVAAGIASCAIAFGCLAAVSLLLPGFRRGATVPA